MKNVFLILGAVVLLCATAVAQEPSVGVTGYGFKLGFGLADISTDYDELNDYLDSRVGFSGGAFLTYSLNRQFAIQPELLYVSKGSEKGVFFFNFHWSADYLEVPVLMKCDLAPNGPVHPNLFAGPAFAYLLSSEIGGLGASYDVSDAMKSVEFSLIFGAAFDYKRITFDVRYTLGLTNTVDSDKINGLTEAEEDDFYYIDGDPAVKNTNLQFMFGMKF